MITLTIAAVLSPEQTSALLDLAATGAIVIGSIFLLPWLYNLAGKIKNERLRKAYLAALELLDAAIIPAVKSTEQTFAKRLRAAPSTSVLEGVEGKLSDVQGEHAMSLAIGQALTQLGDPQLDRIAANMHIDRAALDKVIRIRAEAALLDLKTWGASVLAPAAGELTS